MAVVSGGCVVVDGSVRRGNSTNDCDGKLILLLLSLMSLISSL